MLRLRPLAMVIATLALVAGALLFAPIGATQSGVPTLSPTPPVALASPSTTVTTTTTATPRLPKTGMKTWLLALIGLGLVVAGTALRPRGGSMMHQRVLTVVGVGLVVAGEAVRPRRRASRGTR